MKLRNAISKRLVTVACAGALALGAVPLLAISADAGTNNDITIKVSKQKSGGFGGSVATNIPSGEAKNFYLKVRNNSGSQIPVTMGQYTEVGLAPKWFKGFSGSENITAAVEAEDYDFNVGPGKVKKFRWRIKLIEDEGCAGTFVNWPVMNVDSAEVHINGDADCN